MVGTHLVINEILKKIRGQTETDYCRTGSYSVTVKEERIITDYLFSCPVFALDTGEEVGEKWEIKGKKRYHTGINCVTELSGERVTIRNYIGKVSIQCKNCEVSPSRNGVIISASDNAGVINLRMRTEGEYGILSNNTAFALMMAKHYPFLTASGLSAYSKKEQRHVPVLLDVNKCGGGYDVTVFTASLDASPTLEINLYFPKLILDTCPEERYPEKRNPYGAAAFIGKNPFTGDGILYSRLNMAQPGRLRALDIESAKLCMYVFEQNGTPLCYRKAEEGWCSFNMNWNLKTDVMSHPADMCRADMGGDFLSFDITDTVRRSLNGEKFAAGVIINGSTLNSFAAVATADCYTYPQVLEIKYRK